MTEEKFTEMEKKIFQHEVDVFLCEAVAHIEKYAFSILKSPECRNYTPNEITEYLWKRLRKYIGR